MLRGRLQHIKWYSRIALWLALMVFCSIVIIGGWIMVGDVSSTNSLKWLQFCQTFAVFILPVLSAVYLWSEKPLEWLHLNKGMSWKTALMAIGIMLIAIPGINLLSDLNQQITLPEFLRPLEALMQSQEEAAKQLTERFLNVDGFGALCANVALLALLPGISEELTFRGLLQGLFAPKHRTIAIWVAAIIFSFIHFQFYGFIPRMLMGALFGYMLVWNGSLWVPMLMHFTNNAVAVVSYYVCNHYQLDSEWMDSIGAGSTWYLGVISLLCVCLICYFYAREQS